MSIKESDLVTMAASDLTVNDNVRVLDGDVSRNISLQDFSEAQQAIFEALGFLTTASSPAGFSQIRPVTTKLVDYTITEDDSVVLVDTTAGAVIITLPLAADVYNTLGGYGQQFTVKRITDADANTVTVTPAGADLLDGGTVVLAGSSLAKTTFISDGTAWWVVA
jgi:hypothetical protein